MPRKTGTSAMAKLEDCNCELCSAAVDKKMPTTVTVSSARRMGIPSRTKIKKKNNDCKEFCPDKTSKKGKDCKDPCKEPADCRGSPCNVAPCQPKRANIIRRNKRAVKILSKQLRAQKKLCPPINTRYESVSLFPTSKYATRWQPAFSLARASDTGCSKKKRRKPPPPPKKPSLTDAILGRRDCACELMARAIRADLHRHLGLKNYREQINAGVIKTPPPEPKPKSESDESED